MWILVRRLPLSADVVSLSGHSFSQRLLNSVMGAGFEIGKWSLRIEGLAQNQAQLSRSWIKW